jgi:hypothetical protein
MKLRQQQVKEMTVPHLGSTLVLQQFPALSCRLFLVWFLSNERNKNVRNLLWMLSNVCHHVTICSSHCSLDIYDYLITGITL